MRVLIVEDEVKIRKGLAKLIDNHTTHTVIGEAKNGKEGLEMIRCYHPDLVITDIRMPVMGGLEMLKELHEEEMKQHCVLLSGYSEFEYARTAIRYGVDEYLLKPIAANDVTQLMQKIQDKLEQEERSHLGTPENLIRSMILGGTEDSKKNQETLVKLCEIASTDSLLLLKGYLGDTKSSYREHMKHAMQRMKENTSRIRLFYFYLESMQEFYCLFAGEFEEENLLERIERRIRQNVSNGEQPVWAAKQLGHIEELCSTAKELNEFYAYGLVLGYEHVITQKTIQTFTPQKYEYPKVLENKIQTELYRGAFAEVENCTLQFENLFFEREEKVLPLHIKHAYMKLSAYIADISQELGSNIYEQIQSLNLLKKVDAAVTKNELTRCIFQEVSLLSQIEDKKEDIRNYTIKRAINYIREHYQEGISLEHVALRLDITPEYLSTLFNKEVGINFSTFLKRFRISHSKRLLKGSSLKIYEIAQAVGYSDAKYFNRVFKEEEGVSPGEFRQL